MDTMGLVVEDIQHILAEVADNVFSQGGADPAQQAAAEIALQAEDGRRGGDAVAFDRQLLAVAGMLHPLALDLQRLADADPWQVADNGEWLAQTADVQLGNGVAVLLVAEGDALQCAFDRCSRARFSADNLLGLIAVVDTAALRLIGRGGERSGAIGGRLRLGLAAGWQ